MFTYVYILQSINYRDLYIGYTTDLKRRFQEHNRGAAFYTKKHSPWLLIHYEAYLDKDDARRREKYLKTNQGSRLLKRMLKNIFISKNINNRISTT